MDWDEPRKPKGRDIVVGEPLGALSVEDMESRIVALGAEMDRLKAEIDKRRGQLKAADQLFKR